MEEGEEQKKAGRWKGNILSLVTEQREPDVSPFN